MKSCVRRRGTKQYSVMTNIVWKHWTRDGRDLLQRCPRLFRAPRRIQTIAWWCCKSSFRALIRSKWCILMPQELKKKVWSSIKCCIYYPARLLTVTVSQAYGTLISLLRCCVKARYKESPEQDCRGGNSWTDNAQHRVYKVNKLRRQKQTFSQIFSSKSLVYNMQLLAPAQHRWDREIWNWCSFKEFAMCCCSISCLLKSWFRNKHYLLDYQQVKACHQIYFQ